MRCLWLLKRLLIVFTLLFLCDLSFKALFELTTDLRSSNNYNNIDYVDDFNAKDDEKAVKIYLSQMQKGTVYVRPVVEKESKVSENYWCFLKRPTVIKQSREWTGMAGIAVFSAYYDDRPNSLFPKHNSIQILVVSNHTIEGKVKFYCNIFLKNEGSATVKGYVREIWQKGWDPRNSYQVPSLITCPIPKRIQTKFPMYTVSLTRKKCLEGKVAIKVESKKRNGKKKGVAVCVKGLDYQEDISGRLLEWIELQYILGADTITLYYYYLNSKSLKVLKYYEQQGKLSMTPLKLPPPNNNNPIERSMFLKKNRPQKRRHELLPYNDCFYRHIYTHKYVLIIDIDEVIVPIRHSNYDQLLEDVENRVKNKRISSISARNVFKFRSNFTIYPDFHYMTNNRKRSRKTSNVGEYGKSFSSTTTVATVFNHFALHKLLPNVSESMYFGKSEAIKLHYKSECPWESRRECHQLQYDTVTDTSLDHIENVLIERVEHAVRLIGI
ncbi:unnamed protein product [Caenorhabditis bovis]|uniref:Glycosyltransferase family 92 protein n=1 Tax=Caenorhabditis bovis TaxID=2654633 RepID=A0A8S1ENN1_9PELO|nr:unnamed protein product [Caenorhabditis bovis]